MTKHLHLEIERLKKKILSLGAMVEENFRHAINAIELRDEKLALRVIETDAKIDEMEVDLEEDCLKVLALYQPVARDLRYIIAVLKVDNDLERIGDLTVNIANRVIFIAQREKVEIPFDLHTMAEHTRSMVKHSLDALVEMDPKLASRVCAYDENVDRIHRDMFPRIEAAIRSTPDNLESLITYMSISRHLERIADHATNISEDVIYMLEGEIVRHGRREEIWKPFLKGTPTDS
jgi:phosphate transport system protein